MWHDIVSLNYKGLIFKSLYYYVLKFTGEYYYNVIVEYMVDEDGKSLILILQDKKKRNIPVKVRLIKIKC